MGFVMTAVFLWAAVGVGSRPVSTPLNDAKVECIIQETLNEDGSHQECAPQLAEELDEVQRHQGLLRELQRLADDEKEIQHEEQHNVAEDDYDVEPRDEGEKKLTDGTNSVKRNDEKKESKTEEDNTKRDLMDKPQIEDRATDVEEERAKELEELLAEEINKKAKKEQREDEELKELLKELKKKRYEAVKERGVQKGSGAEIEEDKMEKEEKGDKGEFQGDMEKQKIEERRKNEVELMEEKAKVEKELKELLKEQKSTVTLQQEQKRKEKQEELDELVRKMKQVQEEEDEQEMPGLSEGGAVGNTAVEEKIEKEEGKGSNGSESVEVKKKEAAASEVREPPKKRVMEKASDEATRQFDRDRYKDEQEADDGEEQDREDEYVREDEEEEDEDEEEDEGEELLEIEAELRKVAAELRALRRG